MKSQQRRERAFEALALFSLFYVLLLLLPLEKLCLNLLTQSVCDGRTTGHGGVGGDRPFWNQKEKENRLNYWWLAPGEERRGLWKPWLSLPIGNIDRSPSLDSSNLFRHLESNVWLVLLPLISANDWIWIFIRFREMVIRFEILIS